VLSIRFLAIDNIILHGIIHGQKCTSYVRLSRFALKKLKDGAGLGRSRPDDLVTLLWSSNETTKNSNNLTKIICVMHGEEMQQQGEPLERVALLLEEATQPQPPCHFFNKGNRVPALTITRNCLQPTFNNTQQLGCKHPHKQDEHKPLGSQKSHKPTLQKQTQNRRIQPLKTNSQCV
jgi:hypothetical protein